MITAAPGTLHVADIQTFADQSQSGHCAVLTRLQDARTDHASCSAYSLRYTEASSLSEVGCQPTAGLKTPATKKTRPCHSIRSQGSSYWCFIGELQSPQLCFPFSNVVHKGCIAFQCKIRTHDPARAEGNPSCIQIFLTSSVTLPYAGTLTGTQPVIIILKYKVRSCCLLDVFG